MLPNLSQLQISAKRGREDNGICPAKPLDDTVASVEGLSARGKSAAFWIHSDRPLRDSLFFQKGVQTFAEDRVSYTSNAQVLEELPFLASTDYRRTTENETTLVHWSNAFPIFDPNPQRDKSFLDWIYNRTLNRSDPFIKELIKKDKKDNTFHFFLERAFAFSEIGRDLRNDSTAYSRLTSDATPLAEGDVLFTNGPVWTSTFEAWTWANYSRVEIVVPRDVYVFVNPQGHSRSYECTTQREDDEEKRYHNDVILPPGRFQYEGPSPTKPMAMHVHEVFRRLTGRAINDVIARDTDDENIVFDCDVDSYYFDDENTPSKFVAETVDIVHQTIASDSNKAAMAKVVLGSDPAVIAVKNETTIFVDREKLPGSMGPRIRMLV